MVYILIFFHLSGEFHALDFDGIFQSVRKLMKLTPATVRICHYNTGIQHHSSSRHFLLICCGSYMNKISVPLMSSNGTTSQRLWAACFEVVLNAASLPASLNRLLDDVPQGFVQCLSSIFLRIGNALSA
jgi:hypothetical protein